MRDVRAHRAQAAGAAASTEGRRQLRVSAAPTERPPFPRTFLRDAQGTTGNAAQYLTRNQALKKLQLKLSQFRCARRQSVVAAPHALFAPLRSIAPPAGHANQYERETDPPCPLHKIQAPVHPQGHPPA